MKIKKNIIIPSAYFCSWNGGVKLVKTVTDSLIDYDKKNHFHYILLVPDKNFISFFKRFFNIFKTFFTGLCYGNFFFKDCIYNKSAKELRRYFETKKNLSIIGVDYIQEKNFLEKGINLLSMNLSYNKYKIGYLFDFQHKYYPNFFSKKQIKSRNNFFKKIIHSNNYIIVNSIQTKKDIFRFIQKFKTKIFVLPFAPYLDFSLDFYDTKKKNFDDYFIICNQFWKHKNFETVIQAMYYLKDKNFKLYITGQVDLKTNYNYYLKIKSMIKKLNLENQIIYLGHLEKKKQLSLILNSKALIQPSLYEGGPGGFSVYEALSLNKKVLVSDINVNKEITNSKVVYFKKKNSKDLYKKMLKILNKNIKPSKKKTIIYNSQNNKKKLGKEIFNFLKKVEIS